MSFCNQDSEPRQEDNYSAICCISMCHAYAMSMTSRKFFFTVHFSDEYLHRPVRK